MRLWVNPDRLAKLGITVTDISNAIQAQNTVNPAGQVGGEPAPRDQQYTYAALAQGRLTTPEQFGDVIVRGAPNGGIVRVKDVARVEAWHTGLQPDQSSEWQAGWPLSRCISCSGPMPCKRSMASANSWPR